MDSDQEFETYQTAKILILSFAFHDLEEGLNLETEKVFTVFRSLGFVVDSFSIPMTDSERQTKAKLREFFAEATDDAIYVVYYHGHAGRLGSTLYMSSHNYPEKKEQLQADIHYLRKALLEFGTSRQTIANSERLQVYQPVAGISWESIRSIIMDAECDTLIILDCCDAGLAAVTAVEEEPWAGSMDELEPFNRFRKELIGACSWGTSTMDRMSDAMCDTLTASLKGPNADAISMPTLVRRMNNELVRIWVQNEKQEHVPQAVHFLLARTERDRIIIEAWPAPEDKSDKAGNATQLSAEEEENDEEDGEGGVEGEKKPKINAE